MTSYTVRRMDTLNWKEVPVAQLHHTPWLTPCPISAQVQACHDGSALYVRLETVEENIRATLTGKLDQVCDDSCLEFFFAPMAEDHRYFNIECNPLGNLYLGFGGPRKTRVRQILKNPDTLGVRPFKTDGGWGVELTIPLEFVQMYFPDFTFSGEARANFYKCGDQTEIPHYLAWAPLTSETPDYHRRQDFGRLVFE